MKKYYIPTSSLNFNNILSTESISPKTFYDRRNFGYTRWFTVEENNMEGMTLLYGTPHIFFRPDSNLEDHPMLIEISTNDEFQQLSESVFYTDKTIYLNPWETKFHFFSEKVKRIVLSMSDSSLETKMVHLYERKMVVSAFEGEYDRVAILSAPINEDVCVHIEEDYIINKMKGLLYGYYIGANLSMSSSQVNQLKTLREIQDIFLSIRSSNDKQPSESQKKRLDELFLQIDNYHPIYADIEREFENESSSMIERIFKLVKKYMPSLFKSGNQSTLISRLQQDIEPNPSISWIETEIAKLDREITSKKVCLNPDKTEIIVSFKDRLISQRVVDDELMSNLMEHWINDVFCSRLFDGRVSPNREQLSDEITTKAKEIIGHTWHESSVRTYLNQLRRHLRGEEFDQSWDNGLLSSIAAVLIKGDDWQSLLRFMQSKGMYDYRLAFAIYGVLNGFANMTRDFTDNLLNEERNYLGSVYREFYRQLYQKDLPKKVEVVEINNGLDSTGIQESWTQCINSETDNGWVEGIRCYARSVVKKNKKQLLNSLDDALRENGHNRDYNVFFRKLAEFEGWSTSNNKKSSASLKRLREYFLKEHTEEEHSLELFDNNDIQQIANIPQSGCKGILRDLRWIHSCASLISDPKAKAQFIEDAEWFVENHQESYFDKRKKKQSKGWYFGSDRSNDRVKERLGVYLRNKSQNKKKDMEWLVEIYQKIPVDNILDKISEMYGV